MLKEINQLNSKFQIRQHMFSSLVFFSYGFLVACAYRIYTAHTHKFKTRITNKTKTTENYTYSDPWEVEIDLIESGNHIFHEIMGGFEPALLDPSAAEMTLLIELLIQIFSPLWSSIKLYIITLKFTSMLIKLWRVIM